MRISWEASKTCEPLFRTYVEAMATLVLFQRTHFETGPSGADVASDTLRILTSFQIDRCQGAYCLLVNGLVWDAEIVLRAAYETFAKVALIASSSPSQRASLVDEYWNDLSDIYDRKGASKAAAAERLADEHDPQSVRVFAALQDEKHFNLDPKGNKAARSKIEQRWSFSGILYRLSQDGSDLKPVGLDGLAHMYSMASHIAHANSKALELMQDRQLRGSDLHDLEVGHVCRMLSDLVSLTCFSLFWSERCLQGATDMPKELRAPFEQIHAATAPYQEAFNRSQDDFYG